MDREKKESGLTARVVMVMMVTVVVVVTVMKVMIVTKTYIAFTMCQCSQFLLILNNAVRVGSLFIQNQHR